MPAFRLPLIGLLALVLANALRAAAAGPATWAADNGNGTFTNPLFYDEFSDPDLIRVGNDFYLTGTTMHTMPGLPVLHSVDLVNWELLGYACARLDLGPEFRLEDGKEIYGQGIWAPSFRYHNGTFQIFTNVNRHTTQLFRATNPSGPWTHTAMKRSFHDLSVLFDDDGRAYIIWGYQDIHFAQLDETLTDIVPGTEKIIIHKGAGMGEGLHWYKINGKYYITSAWYENRMRMPAARADRPDGPYEVNQAISIDEDFGLALGYRLWKAAPPFAPDAPNPRSPGHISMHQGGIVDTPTGEWWGFSMMDANSVGRLTCLSPVTWEEGWPYFGLSGNLRRTPRTWVKPNTGRASSPSAPYRRNDDFTGPKLANVWQWNHAPVDGQWSLTERAGHLRLHALPAADFWRARNTLTQRSIGPESTPTAVLDADGLLPGDIAGLALLNLPYAWIGVRRDGGCWMLEQFDQRTGATAAVALPAKRVWLRASCDFLRENAFFSYSTDGKIFQRLGVDLPLYYQLKTFQGVRYALFSYSTGGATGGFADFDSFTVEEPHPRGLFRPIPAGKAITLTVHGGKAALMSKDGALAAGAVAVRFTVVDRGLGRVALRLDDGRCATVEAGGAKVGFGSAAEAVDPASTFQWIENPYGDLVLLSLATHRYLRADPSTGAISADHPGPLPDRQDGSCFDWDLAEAKR